MKAFFVLGMLVLAGCGNDRRAPPADVAAGGSNAGAPEGGAGAGSSLDELCDADCAAQAGLSCVDATTCLDRCQDVFEVVSDRGCASEYTAMLECVASVDRKAYVCLDSGTFGFDDTSPCLAYSDSLSECLRG